MIKKGAGLESPGTCFSLFSCMLTFPFMVFNFAPMSLKQWLFLILAGLAAALGQFSITSAYKFAPAKKLSVFDYTQVIFATVWGLIFFQEIPTVFSIIGYVIIIGIAFVRWKKAKN